MIPLVGFLIAAVVGLTGVGAGSVTAPVLILFCAQSPASAVGTSLVFSFAIKAVVAPVYLRRGQVSAPVLAILCLGGVPGVLLGTTILGFLRAPQYQPAILLLVGLTISAMAVFNLYRLMRNPYETVGKDRRHWLPWVAGLIGAEAGFSSAGTGALGTVILMSWTSLKPREVVGTDLWFGLVVSTFGAGWHFSKGDYNSALMWKLAAGGLPGILGGAALSSRLPPRPLKLVLSVLLCVLGVGLCLRAL